MKKFFKFPTAFLSLGLTLIVLGASVWTYSFYSTFSLLCNDAFDEQNNCLSEEEADTRFNELGKMRGQAQTVAFGGALLASVWVYQDIKKGSKKK